MYVCSECGREFDSSKKLGVHKIFHKFGICRCSICGKEFDKPTKLRGHKSAHQNIRRGKNKKKREIIKLDIDSVLFCSYGCGKIAKYKLQNGKVICSASINSCSQFREKQKEGMIKKHGRNNNLAQYTEDVKNGKRKGSNHYIKAKQLGLPKPIISEESRLKRSESHKGRKHSKETREKISRSFAKFIEENGWDVRCRVKYYTVKNILGEEFKVRGKWELGLAEYLTSKNVLWVRKVYLSYIDDEGVKRTYSPDFYLPLFDKYVETKGYFPDKDKRKMELVNKQNAVKIVMGFKKDIDNMDAFLEKIKEY